MLTAEYKMEPLMNPLFNIYVNTVEDYFRRLGGSGRFTGYKDWYSPSLVLMELIEVNIPGDVFKKIKYDVSSVTSPSMILSHPIDWATDAFRSPLEGSADLIAESTL